jgi:EAL domain-containing protein (putative c-di-GMP-specific phosphodiesterase class I)
MIQKIGSPAHDDAFLQGLAKLCAEMQIDTIAEWIETEAQAKAVAAMGFHHGQGKWFGAPVTEIPSAAVGPGKRRGVTESWG